MYSSSLCICQSNDDCGCDTYECDGYIYGTTEYADCISTDSLWLDADCTYCTSCYISSNSTSLNICYCDTEANCNMETSNAGIVWWIIIGSIIASVFAIFICFATYFLMKQRADDHELAKKQRKHSSTNREPESNEDDINDDDDNQKDDDDNQKDDNQPTDDDIDIQYDDQHEEEEYQRNKQVKHTIKIEEVEPRSNNDELSNNMPVISSLESYQSKKRNTTLKIKDEITAFQSKRKLKSIGLSLNSNKIKDNKNDKLLDIHPHHKPHDNNMSINTNFTDNTDQSSSSNTVQRLGIDDEYNDDDEKMDKPEDDKPLELLPNVSHDQV